MDLTPAQEQTLKANILATPETAVLYTDGNLQGLADYYNAQAAPAWIVWKTSVDKNEVGKTFVASALAAITAGNNDKLANFAAWNETVNPSRADQRLFFDDVFSVAAGASTRAALLVLWKRSATAFEKLYATGTGSDATPATLVIEGIVTYQVVEQARRS